MWYGKGGKQACREERVSLWAGLLAKCDWNLGSELGSGTGDWHVEPQAVRDDFEGLERSKLMYWKSTFDCCLETPEIQHSLSPRAFIRSFKASRVKFTSF